ncbi:Uncharacterised protein [Chlamydia trachomatis]|nr:Uncharacterised protein [Chlamydia trachomatis]
MPYFLLALLESSKRPFARLIARAVTPNNGKPTPVTIKPIAAGAELFPALAPRNTGKIRFPAPKNMPNNMTATYADSIIVKFLFFGALSVLTLCVVTLMLHLLYGEKLFKHII